MQVTRRDIEYAGFVLVATVAGLALAAYKWLWREPMWVNKGSPYES